MTTEKLALLKCIFRALSKKPIIGLWQVLTTSLLLIFVKREGKHFAVMATYKYFGRLFVSI